MDEDRDNIGRGKCGKLLVMTRELKVDVVQRIAHLIYVPAPRMSTGSTEPREIFDLVVESLGLEYEGRKTKPELAQFITESAGLFWGPSCESRGGTVTLEGLKQVEQSVRLFLGEASTSCPTMNPQD